MGGRRRHGGLGNMALRDPRSHCCRDAGGRLVDQPFEKFGSRLMLTRGRKVRRRGGRQIIRRTTHQHFDSDTPRLVQESGKLGYQVCRGPCEALEEVTLPTPVWKIGTV